MEVAISGDLRNWFNFSSGWAVVMASLAPMEGWFEGALPWPFDLVVVVAMITIHTAIFDGLVERLEWQFSQFGAVASMCTGIGVRYYEAVPGEEIDSV